MKNEFHTSPLKPMKCETVETKDDVHGVIPLCPLMQILIDVRFFQRLRWLRQLGVTHYVYVNANHTRFEHSLGVAHLAEKLARVIQKKQPQLGVTEKDVICVKIAGLYHDLGHGPFSHMYDGPFQEGIQKQNPGFVKVEHEAVSLTMIDAALLDLGLQIDLNLLDEPLKQVGNGVDAEMFGVIDSEYDEKKPLAEDKVLTSRDWVFIKECILGEPLDNERDFIGRPKEKEFLYDIVSNRHNGLDVDKIDYYARDEKRALGKGGGLFEKFINEAFIAKGVSPCKTQIAPSTHYMISYPEKLVKSAMDFFKTRFKLHSKVYMHKTKQVELLVCQILSQVDTHFRIPNGSLAPVKMSEAMHHPEAFVDLNDSIIDQIEYSIKMRYLEFDNQDKVLGLITRLRNRDLYKCAATLDMDESPGHKKIWNMTEKDIAETMIQQVRGEHISNRTGDLVVLEPDDIHVIKRVIHHGMKDKNPVNLMRFLPKHKQSKLAEPAQNLPEAITISETSYRAHIPQCFQERTICVYSTSQEKRDLVSHVFEQFKENVKDGNGKFEQTDLEIYESPVRGNDEGAMSDLHLLTQESPGANDDNEKKVASSVKAKKRSRFEEGDGHQDSSFKSRKLKSDKVKKALFS